MTKQQLPKVMATLVEFQDGLMSLSNEEGTWVSQNGSAAIALFCKAVKNRGSTFVPQIWRRVQLAGELLSPVGLIRMLLGVDLVDDSAISLMHHEDFTISKVKKQVELVIVTPAELGFTRSAHLHEIFSRAVELGLQLCPAEVGPRLRIEYRNQSDEESLFIAMEPILVPGGDLCGFKVTNRGLKMKLSTYLSGPQGVWDVFVKFVFVLPKRHVIDLDKEPKCPPGLSLVRHVKGGQFQWDPKKVILYLSQKQAEGFSVNGSDLLKEVSQMKTFNVNLLDDFLENSDLKNPDDWKMGECVRFILFPQTVYVNQDGEEVVRLLYFDIGEGWLSGSTAIKEKWPPNYYIAMCAD